MSRTEDYWSPEEGEKEYQPRTEETNYLYDGLNIIKEYTGNGSPLAEYHMGEDQVIARNMFGQKDRKDQGRYGNLRTRGGLLYYHYDALGSVSDLTDHLGENTVKYRWDAFGGMFAGTLAPYSFKGITGKDHDPKSGLMFYNSRWYDPQTGRFTQPDSFKGIQTQPGTGGGGRLPGVLIADNSLYSVRKVVV